MNTLGRRTFLHSTGLAALAAGSAGAPFIRSARAEEPAANDKIRIGLIGCGGMGQGDLNCFFLNPEVECAVVCDVDDARLAKGVEICESKRGKKPDTVKDFRRVLDRKDVDAVLIATPDHWHALPAVLACHAGKDVYVEKPLAKTIDEGRAMLEAAKRHGRVVQMGSQWRSCAHIIEAAELIRSGKLGKVSLARGWAFLDWLPTIGKPADCPPPAGVDYDLWLGPAPARPFNPNRFHYNWHWFWDYGNGDLGNQGVHEMDMARWGLGVGLPQRVNAAGGHYLFDDDQETPNTMVCTFDYPEQKKLLVFEVRHWMTNREGLAEGPGNEVGVTFFGSEGYMQVKYFEYHTYLGKQREPGPTAKSPPNEYERFIAAVRSRKIEDLGVDIEDGHQSSALCHLGNIAYRLGRTVKFDPKTETFPGDAEANAMLSRDDRPPFVVPKIV